MVDGDAAVGDHVNDLLYGKFIYFHSWKCFGDSLEGEIVRSFFDVKEDAQNVTFLSYSPFDFLGDLVQVCFSRATLSEAKLPFVQVSGVVEVVLHVPKQHFLPEFEQHLSVFLGLGINIPNDSLQGSGVC